MPVLTVLLPLLNLWRWAKWGLGVALRWAVASPARLWAVVAVALALVAGWQHREAAHWADLARTTQRQWQADRAQALATQRAAEQRYRSLADEADHNHAALVAQGDARLAAYIASHRVQPAAQAHSASPTQTGGAALFEGAPAQAVLAISEADVRACDADYAYAQAAFEWARGLTR